MDEKLKKDIEAHVATIFSEKEEAEMRRKTEDALQKAAVTIEDLTNSLEEKTAEADEVESKFSESTDKVSTIESELEAAKEEIENVKTQLSDKESEIEEMKKDRAADVRMDDLGEAGVVHKNEEAKTNQIAKVREMSDDEFAAYKDELISVRQAVMDELAAAEETSEEKSEEGSEDTEESEENETGSEEETDTETEDTEENTSEESSEEEGSEEEGSEEESSDDDSDDSIAANIDHGKAVFAALNMDYRPIGSDLAKKYAELGKAMADSMTGKSDK